MTTDSKTQQPATATAGQEFQQTVAQILQLAVNHHKSGGTQAAEDLYRAILNVQPKHPDANHNLGVLIAQSSQPLAGLPFLQAALETQPENEQYWLSYIDALIQDKQFDIAAETLALGRKHGLQGAGIEKLADRLLIHKQERAQTNKSEAPAAAVEKNTPAPSRQEIKRLTNLRRKGKVPAIEAYARELTQRFPDHGLGWKTLASMLEKQQLIDEALRAAQKAVELLPEDHEVHNALGALLEKKARFPEAETHFTKALQLKPNFVAALSGLGNLLRIQRRLPEAEALFLRALKLESSAVLHNNFGTILMDQGRILEAESSYRRAIEIQPGFALAHTNLGVSLRAQGRLTDAIVSQRRALKIDPESTEKHSNLLFTLNYTSGTADLSHLEEARKYGRMVAKKVKEPFSDWRCATQPERLRVGVVSGDLFNHPVGYFLESLLEKLNPDRVELIAYPTNPKADDLTNRMKAHFSQWKPLFGLSDDAAARMIHADGVHLLLDLSGHTSHNRLPMLVRKPAPVQVSWLGYFATTGVAAIDYFLADKIGVPEAQQENFTEALWYLPDTRLCFSAPEVKLSVAPLPAQANGHITFGCFQKLTKVGDDVLAAWSAILAALPTARLRWQCGPLSDPTVVKQLFTRLQRFGIDPARVTVQGAMPRSNYLAAHAEVDLILDTFPFPGGTTTCEALWMGVPTVTLAGDTLLSRQGASLLSAAGLSDWVADSEEEYIAKAIALASDVDTLSKLRAQLREQVLSSAVFNAEKFAANFEDALWGMWQAGQPEEAHLEQFGQQQEEAVTADEEKPVMNFFNSVFWGTKDPEHFTNLMRQAAEQTTAYHFGDNMFLFQRNNSMLNDQPFMQSWEKNAISPPDRTIIWRRYILTMAGFHCQHLEGDFVECGAYQGVGAKTVIDYLGGPEFKKTFWLYDLFEHNEKMANHSMQAHGPKLHDQVVKRFVDYPNVKIFKGFLPEVLAEGCPEKIAYLHLDLNQAPAEIATLDALFERVVPGGMIILDDYEMVFYRAQKLAEDTWFAKRGYKVFPLPTSQGFVIKR